MRKETLASILRRSRTGVRLNEHIDPTVMSARADHFVRCRRCSSYELLYPNSMWGLVLDL